MTTITLDETIGEDTDCYRRGWSNNVRCVDALDKVTEQRDRLAEALIKCREDSVCEQVRMEKCRYTKAADESQANIDRADKALQYLNQPTKP